MKVADTLSQMLTGKNKAKLLGIKKRRIKYLQAVADHDQRRQVESVEKKSIWGMQINMILT